MPRPAKEFKGPRNSKVTIWKNDTGYSIVIQPPQYKSDADTWKEGQFWHQDLPGVKHMIARAIKWLDDYEEHGPEK